MDTPSPKQQDDRTRFVEPSLRSSSQQPSRRRIALGLALLLVGLVAIFFGGSGVLGQALIIGGSSFVVVSLFVFRPGLRVGLQQEHRHDMRKLYATNKT